MESKEPENWVVKIPHAAKSTALARILIILVFGLGCGYFYDRQGQLDREKADRLTFAEYQSKYEIYKENLRRKAFPTQPLSSGLGILVACFLYGSYELAVALVGLLIKKLIP